MKRKTMSSFFGFNHYFQEEAFFLLAVALLARYREGGFASIFADEP